MSIGNSFATIHVDGGSRGNPGPSGCGINIKMPDGSGVKQYAIFLGDQTNNYAEYSGLIAALHLCRELGIKHINIYADSELMIKQLRGEYRVKSLSIKPLYDVVCEILRHHNFVNVNFHHTKREGNSDADGLANIAMDNPIIFDASQSLPLFWSPRFVVDILKTRKYEVFSEEYSPEVAHQTDAAPITTPQCPNCQSLEIRLQSAREAISRPQLMRLFSRFMPEASASIAVNNVLDNIRGLARLEGTRHKDIIDLIEQFDSTVSSTMDGTYAYRDCAEQLKKVMGMKA